MTQETVKIIDPNDAMIAPEIIKVISDSDLEKQTVSRDISQEAQIDSKTIHAIVLTAQAHKVVFRFGDRRPSWSNEYPRTNLSLRRMSFIGCDSSKHTFADRKCTPSLEQIKTNLMNRNFPVHKAEAIVQSHKSRIISNIRHSKASNSSSETPTQSSVNIQVSTLKESDNKSHTLSHIRHFNIPKELLDSMEEQRLENILSMHEQD